MDWCVNGRKWVVAHTVRTHKSDFEPIASVDGQGFFLEDMYLVTKGGAELLTPGVPYSAEQIEAAMRGASGLCNCD